MSWNYRVVRQITEIKVDGISGYETQFGIHEAYYEEDKTCSAISEARMGPFGETLQELISDHELMAKAFTKPVLDWETRKEVE